MLTRHERNFENTFVYMASCLHLQTIHLPWCAISAPVAHFSSSVSPDSDTGKINLSSCFVLINR